MPIEPDDRQQQDGPNDVQRTGDGDGGRRVGSPEQRHSDLDGKRRQEQFDVPDAELAEPSHVAANQNSDG